MFGYIYITTNLITNEQYIGKHLAKSFDDSYKGSGVILTEKIKEYGWDNFECNILPAVNGISTICETLQELNEAEKYYIDLYNCVLDEHFYNLKAGGDGFSGGPVSDYTKAKISAWNTNKILIHNDTNCIKIDRTELQSYIANGWIEGPAPYTRTDSFKQKVAATITGQIGMHKGNIKTKVAPDKVDEYLALGYSFGWVDETNLAYKKNLKSIPGAGTKKYMHSDNIYKLVPESRWDEFLKDGWEFGGKPRPNVKRTKGYHLSKEHIEKLKISHLGHKNTPEAAKKQADKLRGRVWVHTETDRKMIQPTELDLYLQQGWETGTGVEPYQSKAVVCYETGEEFESRTAAHKKYHGALKRCLLTEYWRTCAGYHWYFKGDDERKNKIKSLLETGKTEEVIF